MSLPEPPTIESWPEPAGDGRVAGGGVDDVVARAADDRIVARAGRDGGVAGGGVDDVVARAADDRIVARAGR